MQVSATEAITKRMVMDRAQKPLSVKNFEGCSSIDLTLRTVLHRSNTGKKIKDGESFIEGVTESYHSHIEPQETVYLISEEFIRVPAGYVAYVFLKNRFSQRGLLAFNTGIVDGGYNGPIATLLTNISSDAYTGAIRTSIPALSGHPFRFNPDTDSGINQPVFC